MILNLIFGLCLNLVLAILSFIIPKEKNRFLFGARRGKNFYGNPKFFFLYLRNNKHLTKCSWITSDKTLFLRLKEKIPVVYLYSWKGFSLILRSEFLIFDTTPTGISYSYILPGKFFKVQTWHGSAGIKNLDHALQFKHLNWFVVGKFLRYLLKVERKSDNLVLTCSEHWKKTYSQIFSNKNIQVLGVPRNDIFFDQSRRYEDYGKKINLKKYNKILLYCPTFREDRLFQKPFSKKFLVKLNDFLKKNNFVLLDKRHPNEKMNFNNFDFSNIINITKDIEDIQELLVHVDVLITDYSSTFVDFLLTDRPIIFYPYDFDEYCKTRELKIDYFNELYGPFAMTEDELLVCIEDIDKITGTDEYKKKYQILKNKYHLYQDGKSSDRLYNYLCRGQTVKN